ncbi:MAG: hypothetical protein KGN77_17030 [Xanthomonadaceae bacterium]|nr:hypothetical protein [Xanthomonadaceae bacterium]
MQPNPELAAERLARPRSEPLKITDFTNFTAAPQSSDIPEARALIRDAIAHVNRMVLTGQDEGFNRRARELAVKALHEALSKMTRQMTKTVVRRNVTITEQHKEHLRALVLSRKDEHWTCADIAQEVFGDAVNLGWISIAIAKIKSGKSI